ncbi:Uncharacterised protein [Mycobacterium tuberculosis]|nr:Uncharacterised protein [Mycobacterium tuberculosis]
MYRLASTTYGPGYCPTTRSQPCGSCKLEVPD